MGKGRLAVKLSSKTSSSAGEEAFEDVEETQKAAKEIEKEVKQMKEDEEMARKLQAEYNSMESSGTTSTNTSFAERRHRLSQHRRQKPTARNRPRPLKPTERRHRVVRVRREKLECLIIFRSYKI